MRAGHSRQAATALEPLTGVRRISIFYGLGLAAGALLLRWLEYTWTVRMLSTELYVLAVALAFAGLGLALGLSFGARPPATFETNRRVLEYLGISERERQVLALVAAGLSNREIAARLFVSPNTVKTHLSHLYGKLEVTRRTEAVRKARELRLIP